MPRPCNPGEKTMNVRSLLSALLVIGVAACFAVPAFTEDEAQPEAPHGDPMSEAMAEAAKPGPDHEWMGFMVGSWNVASKFWMGPGEPQTSEAKMKSRWHMGGRHIRSDYAGDMAGKPFLGESTMGFDNTTKQYKTVWIDDMSTDMVRSTGKRTDDVITMAGKTQMPMMGEAITRTVYTKKSDDEYVMEEFWTIEGMGEMKVMELTFTRAK
jgi:hypothetical protein